MSTSNQRPPWGDLISTPILVSGSSLLTPQPYLEFDTTTGFAVTTNPLANKNVVSLNRASFTGSTGPAGNNGTNGTNGTNGLGLTQALAWTPLNSDGFQTIYALNPPLANGEVLNINAIVNLAQAPTPASGSSALYTRRFFGIQNVGGVLSDPVGNTSDSDAVPPIVGSNMAGSAARIAIVGTNVVVQAQRQPGISCFGAPTVDFVRGTPGANAAVTAIAPSSNNPTVASPLFLTLTLNFGGLGATAAYVGLTQLKTLNVINDTTITGFLPTGSYATGSVNVTVTAPSSPLPLVNGFSFQNIPTVSSIAPAQGFAYGGTPFYVTGSSFLGAPVTSVSLNGVNATGIIVFSDTILAATSSVTTAAGTGSVVVTAGAAGTLPNAWVYNDTPLTILGPSNVFAWYEPRVTSQSGGTETAIADLSGNGNNATAVANVKYLASDPDYGHTPSWNFNGTTASGTFGTVTNPQTFNLMDFWVMNMKNNNTARLYANNSLRALCQHNGSLQWLYGATTTWGTDTGVLNTPTTIAAWGFEGTAQNAQSFMAIPANLATPITASAGGAGSPYAANLPYSLFATSDGTFPMSGSLACWVRAATMPTDAQRTKLQAYAHLRFGV